MSLRHFSVLSLVGFRLFWPSRPSKAETMTSVVDEDNNNKRSKCTLTRSATAPQLGECMTLEDHTRFSRFVYCPVTVIVPILYSMTTNFETAKSAFFPDFVY